MLNGKRVGVLVAGILDIGAIDGGVLVPRPRKCVDTLIVALRIVQLIHLVPRDEVPPISGEDRVCFMPDHKEWGQYDLILDYLGFKVEGRQVCPRIGWISVENQKEVKR